MSALHNWTLQSGPIRLCLTAETCSSFMTQMNKEKVSGPPPSLDLNIVVLKRFLKCGFDFRFGVVVSLENKWSPNLEFLFRLKQVSLHDIFVFCCVHLTHHPQKSSSLDASLQLNAATTARVWHFG